MIQFSQLSDLFNAIEKIPNFKSKGEVKNINFYDFQYKNINYAYDLHIDKNNNIVVDFLIRDHFILKKIQKYMSFDKKNKIFEIILNNDMDDVYKNLLNYNEYIKKTIDNIFK